MNTNKNLMSKISGSSSSSSKSLATHKLNDLKNELLTKLNNNKTKMQNRALLSLQKQISTALRPVKLKNIQHDYINNLETCDDNTPKLSLSALKLLRFEKQILLM